MKERPILFSAPMVRAERSGTKTQTRRPVKPQFAADALPVEMPATDPSGGWVVPGHSGVWWCDAAANPDDVRRCPYGQPGDRLVVRETFFAWGRWVTRYSAKKGRDEWHFVDMTVECGKDYLYAADGVRDTQVFIKRRGGVEPMYWRRPAIFIPRRASRITLEITEVRVERLQDISEADAQAEGCEPHAWMPTGPDADSLIDWPLKEAANPYRNGYALLWDQINGAGAWDANPWVWCVSFRRLEAASA